MNINSIIEIGERLHSAHLVAAYGGNISVRLDDNNILITATGTSLGNLTQDDIIQVDLSQNIQDKRLTTEFPLHSLIYKSFKNQVIIHCHPPLTNGYFAVYSDLKALTFETKLYLGNVPVVEQETPSVTKPEEVIEALKVNKLVAIKNHGVVAMAEDFDQAFCLIEGLEEATKTAAIARLFKKDILDDLDQSLKKELNQDSDGAYPMFSKEHIQNIVDLVNQDEFIANKGAELDLTLKMVIKLDGQDQVYRFNFEKGKIPILDSVDDAPFVISAPRDIWELIFLGKLDPFVATTQGKMKLKGELGKLSRWYVPFSRLFELFKQVKFK